MPAGVTVPPDVEMRIDELYSSMLQQFLPYVALAIASFAPQVEVAILLNVGSGGTLPGWEFMTLVTVSDTLTALFALAAVARFELIARIEWQRDVEALLGNTIGYPGTASSPSTHRFVRDWLAAEHAFFGFQARENSNWYAQHQFPTLFWLSRARIIVPVGGLVVAFLAVGYAIWSHVQWPGTQYLILWFWIGNSLASAALLMGLISMVSRRRESRHIRRHSRD